MTAGVAHKDATDLTPPGSDGPTAAASMVDLRLASSVVMAAGCACVCVRVRERDMQRERGGGMASSSE